MQLAELAQARDELHRLREVIRTRAVQAVLDGEQKIRVAEAAGITRATLDAWITAATNIGRHTKE